MKVISARQPWAELIIEGNKKLDLRTYKINYRGPLAIHAASVVEVGDCKRFGFDSTKLSRGAIIGFVNLAEIFELDKVLYEQKEALHLSHRKYRTGLYGWLFESPQALKKPIKFRGRQRVFTVPDGLINGEKTYISNGMKKVPMLANWDPEKPFQLQVVPENNDNLISYRLAIYHPVIQSTDTDFRSKNGQPPELIKDVEIGGKSLQLVSDHVLDALRENGYKGTDLSSNRLEPFALDEVDGVRLSLLFLAIKPLTKLGRIEDISQEIRRMTVEELYYWFSKCTTEPGADRAQKALRVLLAAE